MPDQLFEKNVLITGQVGALGELIAGEVIQRSGRAMVLSPNGEHSKLLPSTANKDNALFLKSTLRKPEAINRALQKAKKFGHLHHALILCGGPVIDGAFMQDGADWETRFSAQNLETRQLASCCLARMLETGGGLITFVVNAHGGAGILRDSVLQATEAVSLSIMQSIADEYSMSFMRTNAIMLGPLYGVWPGDESQLEHQRSVLRNRTLITPIQAAKSIVETISTATHYSGQIVKLGD